MNQKETYKQVIINGQVYYGKHLVIDSGGCGKECDSLEFWSEFLTSLPSEIGMRAYGEPIVARFGDDDENGISGVQLIQTSSITVHTNSLYGDVYLDVFSCKNFNEDTIIEKFIKLCKPKLISHQVILRK